MSMSLNPVRGFFLDPRTRTAMLVLRAWAVAGLTVVVKIAIIVVVIHLAAASALFYCIVYWLVLGAIKR